MKDAVLKNFWSGVLAAVAGVVYVVYMMVTSKGSLSQVIGMSFYYDQPHFFCSQITTFSIFDMITDEYTGRAGPSKGLFLIVVKRAISECNSDEAERLSSYLNHF